MDPVTSDPEMLDHGVIEEENMVERYVMRQLDGDELVRFEAHYLDCPECLGKLELTQQLHQGLKDVTAEEGARTLAKTAILAWLLRRGRPFQGLLAAALLTVVVVPWALLAPRVSKLAGEHQQLEAELAQALAPQAQGPAYFLSPERSTVGEEPSTRIALGTGPEWVALTLQLSPSQRPASCRVRLVETDGATLWESGALQPDAAGRVTFSVHSSWLVASIYHVQLDALDPGGKARPVARFGFGVRRAE